MTNQRKPRKQSINVLHDEAIVLGKKQGPHKKNRARKYSVTTTDGYRFSGLNKMAVRAMIRDGLISSIRFDGEELEQCCGYWGGYKDKLSTNSHHSLRFPTQCEWCGKGMD